MLVDRGRAFVDLECSGRRGRPHPGWEINGIDPAVPPWAGRLGDDERFRCPGCGGIARHTYHYAASRKNGEPGRRQAVITAL